MPTSSNQNFAEGYRLEPAIGKSSYEIQRNGPKAKNEQTTFAVVHYPQDLFVVLPVNQHIAANKIIADYLMISFNNKQRITLGGDVFKHLFSPPPNGYKGDIELIESRNSLKYWFDYNELRLESLLKLRLQSAIGNLEIIANIQTIKTKDTW